MKIIKEFVICNCGKSILYSNFNKHLSTHFYPLGNNCTAWYKDYFKRDNGCCVCSICDEEVYKDGIGSAAAKPYEGHLAEHNITSDNDKLN